MTRLQIAWRVVQVDFEFCWNDNLDGLLYKQSGETLTAFISAVGILRVQFCGLLVSY